MSEVKVVELEMGSRGLRCPSACLVRLQPRVHVIYSAHNVVSLETKVARDMEKFSPSPEILKRFYVL